MRNLIRSVLLFSLITSATHAAVSEDSVRTLKAQLLAQKIDGRVATLKFLSKNIANDHHIHDWVGGGINKNKESVLLDKLDFYVTEYGLTSASFANTRTHRYWNHEGFLRVLEPQIDTWYFSFLNSDSYELVSVYHDKNKHRIDLYVNYRQPNGIGLSGVATSFNGVVKMMADSNLAQQGTLYLVDHKGVVQVHQNLDLLEKTSLANKIGVDMLNIMRQNGSHTLTRDFPDKKIVVDVMRLTSMGWYLVVETPLL